MTPKQFKKEVEALGLTVIEGHPTNTYPFVAEFSSPSALFLDENTEIETRHDYGTPMNHESVRDAVRHVLRREHLDDPIKEASIMEKMK